MLELTNIRDHDLHELELQFASPRIHELLCELQAGRDLAVENESLRAQLAELASELHELQESYEMVDRELSYVMAKP